jgi:hypothetical protein
LMAHCGDGKDLFVATIFCILLHGDPYFF